MIIYQHERDQHPIPERDGGSLPITAKFLFGWRFDGENNNDVILYGRGFCFVFVSVWRQFPNTQLLRFSKNFFRAG